MKGHMDKVLAAAAAAAKAGEVPVAAAITDAKGDLIALAENRMVRDGNALHHAEILAIEAAMAATGQSRLDGYDLWVSLEPCTMCAGAIAHARLRRVYFAAHDEKQGRLNRVSDFLTIRPVITGPRFMVALARLKPARCFKNSLPNAARSWQYRFGRIRPANQFWQRQHRHCAALIRHHHQVR